MREELEKEVAAREKAAKEKADEVAERRAAAARKAEAERKEQADARERKEELEAAEQRKADAAAARRKKQEAAAERKAKAAAAQRKADVKADVKVSASSQDNDDEDEDGDSGGGGSVHSGGQVRLARNVSALIFPGHLLCVQCACMLSDLAQTARAMALWPATKRARAVRCVTVARASDSDACGMTILILWLSLARCSRAVRVPAASLARR